MKHYYTWEESIQRKHSLDCFTWYAPVFNSFTGKFWCEKCSRLGCPGNFDHYTFNFQIWLDKKRKQFRAWIRSFSDFNYSKIDNIEVDGIDYRDAPDFCDAFISYAEYKGKPMSDAQLDRLNENSDFVYSCVEERLY